MIQFTNRYTLTAIRYLVAIGYTLMAKLALAQDGGLVPCEGVLKSGGNYSLGCRLCDLAILGNNIINWLTTVSFALAIIFTMYGGYVIMTAGIKPDRLQHGKDVIKAVVIGLGIILVAWVFINTVLQVLTGSQFGPWNRIAC